MSETVSWQFVGRRLDSVQARISADIRRQMITLADRFGALESRMAGIEHGRAHSGGADGRDGRAPEQAGGDRCADADLLQRLALKVGGIDDDTA